MPRTINLVKNPLFGSRTKEPLQEVAPVVNMLLLFCLLDIVSNCPLNSYLSTDPSMQLSNLEERSFFLQWIVTVNVKRITGPSAEIKWLHCAQPQDLCSEISTPPAHVLLTTPIWSVVLGLGSGHGEQSGWILGAGTGGGHGLLV